MPELKELNDHVGLGSQLQSSDEGPVVLVNVFTVDPADQEAMVAAWRDDALYMKKQPGYISTQLH